MSAVGAERVNPRTSPSASLAAGSRFIGSSSFELTSWSFKTVGFVNAVVFARSAFHPQKPKFPSTLPNSGN